MGLPKKRFLALAEYGAVIGDEWQTGYSLEKRLFIRPRLKQSGEINSDARFQFFGKQLHTVKQIIVTLSRYKIAEKQNSEYAGIGELLLQSSQSNEQIVLG